MTATKNSAGIHSIVQAVAAEHRVLLLLAGFLGCLAGGFYAPSPWFRLSLLTVAACAGLAASIAFLTRFLSLQVSRQRWKYKTKDEAGRTIVVPNHAIQGQDVRRLFGHPNLNTKFAVGLRQLILWWHAPCSELHQEIMEQNDLYLEVKSVTSSILSTPVEEIRILVRAHLDEAMLRVANEDAAWSITRLRTIVGPIALSFCYELVLGRKCPPEILPLLIGSTADVIAATGAMSRRNMPLRMKALAHVRSALEGAGGRPEFFGDNCPLTLQQRAQYLQGVWIHTASAQILRLVSNAICHLSRNRRCLEIVRREIGQVGSYADAVLLETLRLTPGISSTNRVASNDIIFGEGVSIPAGTNIVFNLENYQRTGFDRPDEFVPERWSDGRKKDSNFMPFGTGKRRCPAERFTLIVAKEILLGMLASLDFHVPAGGGFLFSAKSRIANDLCCVVRRPSLGAIRLWGIRCWLAGMLAVENIRKSFVQLAIMPKNAGDAFREHEYRSRRGTTHEVNP